MKPDKALMERNHRLVKRYLLPLSLAWLAFMYMAANAHGGIGRRSADPGAPKAGAYGSR